MSKIKIKDLYTGENILLIGNGVNLLSAKLSWKGLLNKLLAEFKIKDVKITDDKSYPLIFEEILKTTKLKNPVKLSDFFTKLSIFLLLFSLFGPMILQSVFSLFHGIF